MNESKIPVRYAKAFFESGKDKDILNQLYNDLELIDSILTESERFNAMLESPVIKSSDKIKALKSIFENKLNDLSLKFLYMLAQNKREVYLKSIIRNFAAMYRKDQSIIQVKYTAANPINNDTKESIKSKLENSLNQKIELKERLNPDLIGGFVLQIEDKLLDMSIKGKLNKIKKEFAS
ncbi:MAG: ATP synthase F1 subunit delta [Marinifilaceae bacterium]|jgi:F-type H+-transporting ATPase subunit delta|nr:ATP synthase F1 subunit delta [Marinifilaceae bacterium]